MKYIKFPLQKGVFYTAFILASLISINVCHAQSFNGFASIRLGQSETDFLNAIKNDIKSEVKIVTDKNVGKIREEWLRYQVNKNESFKLYQLKYSGDFLKWPIVLYDNYSIKISKYTDSCNIYFLPKYKLGEIELENIFVVFRNQNLGLIELNNSDDLIKAAKEKYKPSEDTDTTYKIKCLYVTSGIPEEKIVSKSYSKWVYEDNTIEASSGIDYDENCKVIAWSYIRFINGDVLSFLSRNNNKEKDNDREAERKKINTLKDKL